MQGGRDFKSTDAHNVCKPQCSCADLFSNDKGPLTIHIVVHGTQNADVQYLARSALSVENGIILNVCANHQ